MPEFLQALLRYGYFGPQLLGKQRYPVFFQHPAPLLQTLILSAFQPVALDPGAVLLAERLDLVRPDPITLHLSGQFVQPLSNSCEVARILPQPLRRHGAHEAFEYQLPQLFADIIHGDSPGQVDLALEALLYRMPGLENAQYLRRE